MKQYLDYLDSRSDTDELNAPALLVDKYGIEYRIAVNIVSEWLRIRKEKECYADRYNRKTGSY